MIFRSLVPSETIEGVCVCGGGPYSCGKLKFQLVLTQFVLIRVGALAYIIVTYCNVSCPKIVTFAPVYIKFNTWYLRIRSCCFHHSWNDSWTNYFHCQQQISPNYLKFKINKIKIDIKIVDWRVIKDGGQLKKDADERGRVEGILKVPQAAAIRHMSDHGSQLRSRCWFYGGRKTEETLIKTVKARRRPTKQLYSHEF